MQLASLDILSRTDMDYVSIKICSGVRFNMVSNATVGAECHPPVIALHTSLWNLFSLSMIALREHA